MSLLQVLVSIVQATAWPVTLLVIVLLLREPISGLIPALRKLKFKELELEFREKLSPSTGGLIPAINEKSQYSDADSKLLHSREYYLDIGRISQRAAILEAWVEVEAAASAAFIKHASAGVRIFASPREALEFLRSKDYINSMDYGRSRILSDLRNKAAHEIDLPNFSAPTFESFIDACLELASRIHRVTA